MSDSYQLNQEGESSKLDCKKICITAGGEVGKDSSGHLLSLEPLLRLLDKSASTAVKVKQWYIRKANPIFNFTTVSNDVY